MKRPLAVLFGIILALLIVISLSPLPRSVRASVDEVYGQNGTPAATYATTSISVIDGSVFTTAADMNVPITDGHFYGKGATASGNAKFVICLHSTLVIVAYGVSNPVAFTTTAGWRTATWSTPPTLAASTEYILGIISDQSFRLYDYDTSAIGHTDSSNDYTTPQDWGTATHINHQFCIYCHYTPNNAPVNVACYCINLDDGTVLYGRYKAYTFNCTVTDADGATNLNTVTMYAGVDPIASPTWVVQYTEGTNTFSEYSDPSNYITLNTGSCTYSKSGTTLKVYFSITINWNHPDTAPNYDLGLVSVDDASASDPDVYNVNYCYWTQTDFSTYTLADGVGTSTRGNVNGVVTASGVVCYAASSLRPPAAEVDVWILCTDVAASPWQATNYEATGGTFSVTVYADDAVGLDTYTFKLVAEGAGSSGDDQCHATHTTTYIADRVTITLCITYSKIGVGQNCSGLLESGIYQYDSTPFPGAITLNSTSFSYATAGYRGYTTAGISGDTYGVTSFTTNSLTVLWQNITVTWSHFWTRYSEVLWFAHIDIVTMKWSVEGSTLPTGATVLFYENGSIFTTDTVNSGAVGAVHDYGATWRVVIWTLKLTYVAAPYNVTALLFYTHAPETVPVVHTLYPDIYLSWTDLYLYIEWTTNWHNASLYLWDNVSTLLGSSIYEGITQIVLPTAIGLHRFDILVNGSSPHAGKNTGAYPPSDYWRWYHLNFTVSVSAFTTLCMVFKQADGLTVIPWLTFHVYVDDYECPQSQVVVAASSTVNVTITDDYGYLLWQNLAFPTGSGVNTFLKQTLTVYYAICNNGRNYPQDALVVRNGVLHWLPAIGAHNSFSYLLYPGSYVAYWFKNGVVGAGGYSNPTYSLATDPAYPFTVSTSNVAVSSGEDITVPASGPNNTLPAFFTIGVAIGFALIILLLLISLLRRGGVVKQEPESVTVGPDMRRAPRTAVPQSHAAGVQAYLNGEQARRAAGVAQLNERLQRRTQQQP